MNADRDFGFVFNNPDKCHRSRLCIVAARSCMRRSATEHKKMFLREVYLHGLFTGRFWEDFVRQLTIFGFLQVLQLLRSMLESLLAGRLSSLAEWAHMAAGTETPTGERPIQWLHGGRPKIGSAAVGFSLYMQSKGHTSTALQSVLSSERLKSLLV